MMPGLHFRPVVFKRTSRLLSAGEADAADDSSATNWHMAEVATNIYDESAALKPQYQRQYVGTAGFPEQTENGFVGERKGGRISRYNSPR
jgi:hypothetical protein